MCSDLPKLQYPFGGLEPIISEQTMSLHYGKHLMGYCDTLARLIKGTSLEKEPLKYIIKHCGDTGICNNAGQVFNHIAFFQQFSPLSKEEMSIICNCNGVCNVEPIRKPKGELEKAINHCFSSFADFRKQMTDAATGHFGSGWVWLTRCKDDARLKIITTPNGETPLSHHLKPLLTFDLWEHAYYLDYQNRKAEYISRLWHIINWDIIEKRFTRSSANCCQIYI